MKRLGIALLLVLVALRGAGAAWAFNDNPDWSRLHSGAVA